MKKRSAFIWGLVFCIVLVNGAMVALSVSHADHQAGTHSTGLCAWLCAVGQGVESSFSVTTSALQLIERVVVTPFDVVLVPDSFYHFFRGPPVSIS